MGETIPGGAYLAADGKSWTDADGKPLSEEQVDAVKALHAERQAARDDQEKAALALAARNNPTAQAIAAALRPDVAAPKPKAAKAGE